MKIYRALLLGAVTGISALVISSCAYDPYYSGSSYSSGYGDGYGYGSSNFSTSFFVRTGNPRWGYDPYAGCYYDYTRRSYYDPYLYGYYPKGYRPRYISGAPHPHGWSRGRSSIAPPSRIRSYNLTNYQNRGERYRSLGRDWSRNVTISNRGRDQRPTYGRDQRNHSGSEQRSNFFGNRGSDQNRTNRVNQGSYQGRSSYDRNRDSNQRTVAPRSGSTRGGFDRGNTTTRAPQPQPQIQQRSASRGGFRSPPAADARRQAIIDAMQSRQGGNVTRPPRQPAPQPQARPPANSGRGENAPSRGNRGNRDVRGLGEG